MQSREELQRPSRWSARCRAEINQYLGPTFDDVFFFSLQHPSVLTETRAGDATLVTYVTWGEKGIKFGSWAWNHSRRSRLLGRGAGYRSESYLEEASSQVARPTARETSGNRRPPYYTHVSLPYGRQGSFQLVDCCLHITQVLLQVTNRKYSAYYSAYYSVACQF